MKTLYARYNRHRLPPFQIETSIVVGNGSCLVVKKALTGEAKSHIAAIHDGHELVRSHLRGVAANPSEKKLPCLMTGANLALPRLENFDGSSISFQYIEGKSLDQLLFEAFRADDKTSFFGIIDDYRALLKESFGVSPSADITAEISRIFGISSGDSFGENAGWLPLALVDAMFENIIMSGNSCYLIDNEWVFKGNLHFDFILFRSLFYFHKVKYFELGIERWLPFADLTARYCMRPSLVEKYTAMDEKFQSHVYGPERCFKYKDRYKKREIQVHALEQTIEHQREVVRKYHDAVLQDEATINEMLNSFSWRIGRKITGILGALCPKSWKERRYASNNAGRQM